MEPNISKKSLWAGRIISCLAVLFMLFDAVIHIVNPPFVVESMQKLGYNAAITPSLGVIVLICTAIYLFPKTSVLGAILFTGYLGGAVATNLRVGSPLFSTTLFPVYVGIFIWGGLYLRNARLQTLIPFRKD